MPSAAARHAPGERGILPQHIAQCWASEEVCDQIGGVGRIDETVWLCLADIGNGALIHIEVDAVRLAIHQTNEERYRLVHRISLFTMIGGRVGCPKGQAPAALIQWASALATAIHPLAIRQSRCPPRLTGLRQPHSPVFEITLPSFRAMRMRIEWVLAGPLSDTEIWSAFVRSVAISP